MKKVLVRGICASCGSKTNSVVYFDYRIQKEASFHADRSRAGEQCGQKRQPVGRLKQRLAP